MNLPQISIDPSAMKIAILTLGGMLALIMARIVFLLRTHHRLSLQNDLLEKQILAQHRDILEARKEANAWKGGMLQMTDACRAEFSKRRVIAEKQCKAIEQMQDALPIPNSSEAPVVEVFPPSIAPLPSLS